MEELRVFGPNEIRISYSNYCEFECPHCQRGNSRQGKDRLSREQLTKLIEEAKGIGIETVAVVGPEIFYDIDTLEHIIKASTENGLVVNHLVTNGFFGEDIGTARAYFERIRDAGFSPAIKTKTKPGSAGDAEPKEAETLGNGELCISIDRFHKVDASAIANTIIAYWDAFNPLIDGQFLVPVHILNVQLADQYKKRKLFGDPQVQKVIGKLKSKTSLSIDEGSGRFQSEYGYGMVNHVYALRRGRAEQFPEKRFHSFQYTSTNLEMVCTEFFEGFNRGVNLVAQLRFRKQYNRISIAPTGDAYACCMYAKPLCGGNIKDKPLNEIVDALDQNPLLVLLAHEGVGSLVTLALLSHGIPVSDLDKYTVKGQPCSVCLERIEGQEEMYMEIATFMKEKGVIDQLRREIGEDRSSPKRRVYSLPRYPAKQIS